MAEAQSEIRPSKRLWGLSICAALTGLAWQYGSLWLIERYVSRWPSVPDVWMDALPRYEFGLVGELWFFGLILLFAAPHFRENWRSTPRVLLALGLFYFLRGWFMFLFPIGAPAGAVSPDDRLNVWGFAEHAYFPGGHIGVLTVLALHAVRPWVRRWLWAGLLVFGVGTVLSKNHYVMDSVAGMILAYAVTVWLERRFAQRSEISHVQSAHP